MKTEKFNNKFRILTNRLQGYDYGANGIYFITICTKNRNHYFGEITINNENPVSLDAETLNCASLRPSIIGNIVRQYWMDIPNHYPFVETDAFVIMPNHIHGILIFNQPNKNGWIPNKFGPQSKNLGAVIRGFKSTTKRYANQHKIEFNWQPLYHESIVRDERGLNNIRQYIENNPKNWIIDTLNNNRL